MKNLLFKIFFAISAIFISIPASSAVIFDTIPPIDDSYVRSADPDVNYGTGVEINLRHQPGELVRYGYFKFIIPSSISEASYTAKLRLWFYNNNNSTEINLWAMGVENDWTEETLTWNNKPNEIAGMDTVKVKLLNGTTSGFYTLDVTSLVQGTGSDTVTIMLRLPGEFIDNVKIATKENGDVNLDPYLHFEITVVEVTGVTLNKGTVELIVDAEETLVATIAPADATNKAVTWSSSNEAIATVDNNGKVTAIAVGTATITVTTEDGDFSANCIVTVVDQPSDLTKHELAKLLEAYPNPLSDQNLVIRTAFDGISKISISDISGKQVYTIETADNELHIPRSIFSSGTYIVSITNNSGVEYVKLIVN